MPVARVAGGDGPGGRLGILAPVLVLALIVVAARAGAAPGAAVPGGLAPSRASPGELSTGVAGAPAAGAAAEPVQPVTDTPTAAAVVGLPVLDGPGVLEARAAGSLRTQLVAIRGFVRNDPMVLACPAIRETLSRLFCWRLLPIFSGADAQSPILSAQVPPGTSVPTIFPTASEVAPLMGSPVPAILVVSLADPRAGACAAATHDSCGDGFMLERIAWLAGAIPTADVARDPAISEADVPSNGRRAEEIEARAASRGERILGRALIGSALLGIVDADAAAAAAGRPGPLWYVRSLARAYPGARPQVTWALIGAQTGAKVARSADLH